MLYLVTDQNNKTWRDIQWGENITHVEDNPNYHFAVYDNPLVAAYMYPTYDGITDPKIWEASGEGQSPDQIGFRNKYAKLTTLKEVEFQNPTTPQRMNFAILCAMNLVLHPEFRNWAIQYLRGIDQTKATAHTVSEILVSQIGTNLPVEYQYYGCAHPVLAAVLLDQPAEFCANAAHRAYFDSLKNKEPLNLEQLAQIASLLPGIDIAEVLADDHK